MSSSVLFLAGGVAFAFFGSLVVWVVSRPRSRPQNPNELRNTLRDLHQNGVKTSRSGPLTHPIRGSHQQKRSQSEQSSDNYSAPDSR
ncbi:MAG: hypothetical protein CL499_00800 [Actinobacteria bacterium]|nr:hypothetical protein [Actinomycetota bacterium]MDC0245268.1 hypothetical protein [Acidimicrobiaceae bacterium]